MFGHAGIRARAGVVDAAAAVGAEQQVAVGAAQFGARIRG
jgi:hypothetical protein